jgi:Protein of unknown function (DUF2950)
MMALKTRKLLILKVFLSTMSMLVAMIVLLVPHVLAEAPVGQKGFISPPEAVAALVAAVEDAQDTELLAILGPGSESLISSGDQVADQNGRAHFLKAYAERNNFEQKRRRPDGTPAWRQPSDIRDSA